MCFQMHAIIVAEQYYLIDDVYQVEWNLYEQSNMGTQFWGADCDSLMLEE